MEFKKDGILFINLLFRVVSLIAFVSDYESPVLPARNVILNWNSGVTDRVVLILANGLRDDFLDEDETPYLREVAYENGTFARVAVDGIVSVEGSLRSLLSGLPWQGAILPWNRPEKYTTILDQVTCKCVIGQLPLDRAVRCQHPGRNQSEVFDRFRGMTPDDCLYVLSFDFGGTSGREYLTMLRELDGEVRDAASRWADTTWLLTSSRGWSVWNRSDWRVDAPLLAWGKGILPNKDVWTIRLTDVAGLVSALLGRNFPAGCLTAVPTYLISADPEAKFHIALYNFEHLEKSLGGMEGGAFDARNLNGVIDEENLMSLRLSIDNFLEMVRGLRTARMKTFAIVAAVCFGLWSVVFLVAVSRGSVPVDVASSIVVVNVIATVLVIVFLKPDVLRVAAMVLLTPITVLSFSDVIKSFRAEGHRMFLLSLVTSVLCTVFTLLGYYATILLLLPPLGLWPVATRVARRMNRKILVSRLATAAVLGVLPSFDVIGLDPTPGVTILSSVLHVALFHFAYHSFKRRVDRQSWVITIAVLSSTYHVYFYHLWGFSSVTCLLFWCFLLYALSATFALRGTLLERLLKFHLLLLIPMQLLSNRHETLFHVALSVHMFSWVFTEHVSVEKSVLLHHPSIFTLVHPTEIPQDSLRGKHYRHAFFFLTYTYLSFFAAGNLPTVYTYDYAILKPFCDACPIALLSLKLALPFASIVYTFLTLQYTQRTDPATAFILSVHYSDVISSCFLLHTYVFTEIFTVNASHYILLQTATSAITALYLLLRYAHFHLKT